MIYLVTTNQELFDNEFYKIISVKESLTLLNKINIVGLDTETTGLNCWTDKLKLLQLGNRDFQVVIDCFTVNVQEYKDYLESNRLFLGWNLKFDLKFLYRNKIYLNKVFDGYLVEKLLYLGYPPGMHSLSLKSASENYLGIERDKSIRGKVIWAGLTQDVIQYSANDVKYLEDIILKQWKLVLEKDLSTAVRVENMFVLPLAYTEYCGIHLDKTKWLEKMRKDEESLNNALNELNSWVVNKFPNDERFTKVDLQGYLFSGFNLEPQCIINWSSPKQVIELFEELGFNLEVKDKKTGLMKKSVDSKVIEGQLNVSEIAPIYLKFRKASKVTSTYGQNFLDQINPISGRIHTNYNQLGADTTRITSGGKDGKIEYVNLLNLPHDTETRAAFTAEKGNKWISIDYSGQETYLMASIANDKAIIKELTEGSGDIHSLTAYLSYKEIPRDTSIKDIKKLYPEYRQEAKGIEFAINYGGNADTISQNKNIPKEEANKIYDNYMSGFSGLRNYQSFRRKDWFKKGYILLNEITKHKAFIYDYDKLLDIKSHMAETGYWDNYRIKKDNGIWDDPQVIEVKDFFRRKSDSERQSINYPIQASGSMCLRFSLIYFFDYIRKNNLFDKVKISVIPYDEINCEAPAEIADEVAKILHSCMVKAGSLFCTRCKLDADISYDNNGELPNYWVH